MQFPPGTTTGDALREALEAGTRRIQARVEFDWDRAGSFDHEYSDLSSVCDSVEDDRQVMGDLPEEVNTLVGYSSAELTVKLSGSRAAGELPAHKIFSPYYVPSPLYGKDVIGTPVRYSRVVDTAIGQVTVRQFTGWVRSFSLSRDDDSVTVVASDVLDLMNTPVTLPMWARFPHELSYDGDVEFDDASARTRPINMTWAVEEAFRQGGNPTGPRARPSAVAYWTCNGSFLPSVGSTDDTTADQHYNHSIRWQNVPAFQNGRYGLEPVPGTVTSGGEFKRRKNQGIAVSPKTVRLPVDTPTDAVTPSYSDITLGFNALVHKENDDALPALNYPYDDLRYLSVKHYFRRGTGTFSSGGAEYTSAMSEMLSQDHGYSGTYGSVELFVFPNGQFRVVCRETNTGNLTVRHLATFHMGAVPTSPDNYIYYDVRVRINSAGAPSVTRAWVNGVNAIPYMSSFGVSPTTFQNYAGIPEREHTILGRNSASEFVRNVSTIYTSISASHVQVYLDSTDAIAAEDAAGWNNPLGAPPLSADGKPLAVIPAGAMSDITHIPDTFRKPAWDLLKELSDAELAIMHTDEWGTKYWIPNYQARAERSSALSKVDERGLTISDDRLLGLVVNPSEDQYRNTITLGYNVRWAEPGVVWEPTDWKKFQTAPGTNVVEFISADDAVMVPTALFLDLAGSYAAYSYPVDFQPGDNLRYMMGRAVRSDDSANYLAANWLFRLGVPEDRKRGFIWRKYVDPGVAAPIQYTSTPTSTGGSVRSVQFNNNLWVMGWKLGTSESGTVTVSNSAEVDAKGIRELVLPDNPWRSWEGTPGIGDGAHGIAESLLQDTVEPAPLVDGVEIPSDPRLQLRDVVALRSEGGITGRIHAEIVGIHRTDTATDSRDRLTLRVIQTPNEWQLGVTGLSELGTTTVLG